MGKNKSITLCALSFLLAGSVQAAGTCQELFDSSIYNTKAKIEAITTSENGVSKKTLKLMVTAVTELIAKTGRIPTVKELADQMKLDQKTVEGYLDGDSAPDIKTLISIARLDSPKVFEEYEKRYAKKAAELLKKNMKMPSVKEVADALDISQNVAQFIYGGNKDVLRRISEYERKSLDTVVDTLLKAYVRVAKEKGRSPELNEFLQELNEKREDKLTLEDLKSLIGKGQLIRSIDDLFDLANKKNEKNMKKVVDLRIFNDERFKAMLKDLKEGERIVVTSAVAGAKPNADFMAALETYYQAQRASLVVMPIAMESTGLNESLINNPKIHVLLSEIEMGPDLVLSNIPLTAKQVNGLTGLYDKGNVRGQTMIIGTTKAEVAQTPVRENATSPHYLFTTGSIHDKNIYQGEKYISGRTDYMSEKDHFTGALIIEKTNSGGGLVNLPKVGSFNFRHIEFIPEKRGFMDLNKFYTPEGVKTIRIENMALGDSHVAQADQLLMSSLRKVIQEMNPKSITLDDLFDGQSISHYERDKIVTLAQKSAKGQLSLQSELDLTLDYLKGLIAISPADTVFHIDCSNHNDWIPRYLQSGVWTKEPQNSVIGSELFNAMAKGENPLAHYFAKKLPNDILSRVVFWEDHESWWIGDSQRKPGQPDRMILASEHGDKGANGAKGSFNSFVKASKRILQRHTHTYRRRNGAVNLPTLGENPVAYSQAGFSNWSQGIAISGPNGETQVLIYHDGQWYRDNDTKLSPKFFPEGYPFAKPNTKDKGAAQVDQWSSYSN